MMRGNQRHRCRKAGVPFDNGDSLERGISEYDLFITSRSWVASYAASMSVQRSRRKMADP